mmetsp:Transcript_109711/g.306780  ORF Transcript_109711/g.306780 Transcript_109711/m.306780 type:complete len:589 (+) Transcript_109711:61-1827(+)
MKHDKVLLLLSSAAPLIAVLGFAPSALSALRPASTSRGITCTTTSNSLQNAPGSPTSTAATHTYSTSPASSQQQRSGSTRQYMFNGNPLDMMSSLFDKSSSAATPDTAQPVNEALSNLVLADWTTVRTHLESKMTTDEERNFRANLAMGYGVTGSPMHKIRLFDESNQEKDIRVTFYRDSASWCPYCQKVWLTLEEKRIPYRVEKINMRCYGEKPDSFKRLQPGGQIPVATIDGTTLRQSNDILFALEDLFPNHKSMSPPPNDSFLKAKAQEYLRLERQLFSAWMYWLTGGGAQAKRNFIETLQVVEKALKEVPEGPFFLGKDITIVDVQFSSFLERMAASLLFYKGFQMRVVKGEPTDYPLINAWFDAMETLPSYQLTKSDYYTHCWDLPPQLGGCVSEPGGEDYEDAINGVRSLDGTQGSWELPLQPHNGGVEPDWEWAGDEDAARREAVERVSGNYEAIVKFAARGAGKKGFPSYGAPLSDPNATPNDAVQPSVDHMMRLVCLALLDGTDAHQKELEDAATILVTKGGGGGGGKREFASAVVASLTYMRDRVGVPRDMRLPAARQLRAHLNWAIAGILDKVDSLY